MGAMTDPLTPLVTLPGFLSWSTTRIVAAGLSLAFSRLDAATITPDGAS